jgi:putative ABC transport system permease protein
VTDFVRFIALATMMATPMAWYYISKWLQHFAYRVHINWWIFGISGLVILIVTVGTISLQVMRAALANPVKSLRTE